MSRIPPNKGRVDYPVSFTLRMKGLQAAWLKKRGGAPAVRQLIDQAIEAQAGGRKVKNPGLVQRYVEMAPARPDASPARPSSGLTTGKTKRKTRKPRTV